MDLNNIPQGAKEELLEMLRERDRYIKYNQIELFKPYPFQEKFYSASKGCKRRFLCAANR